MDRYLLRPEDAAHVLSIGRSKLYELLASGRLTSVTLFEEIVCKRCVGEEPGESTEVDLRSP